MSIFTEVSSLTRYKAPSRTHMSSQRKFTSFYGKIRPYSLAVFSLFRAYINFVMCFHVLLFCRVMLGISAAYAVMRCLSVCLSRSCILSKRINTSSNCFHHRVATPFWFFLTKRHGHIPTRTALTAASNTGGGRQKSRLSANIWLDRVL